MIYYDLDETLIEAAWGYVGSSKSRVIVKFDDGKYGVMRRPLCDRMLQMARAICETRMLTMGTREYALRMNEELNLGFTPEQIIAREDFLERDDAPTEFSFGSRWKVRQRDVCPDAVLIDNQAPDEEYAILKRSFLGIDRDRYIKIRMFYGKDPECFAAELDEIECRLKNLKS